jgi:hypothetical protein
LYGADATRLVDGLVTLGLCIGLATLLRAWPADPGFGGSILAGPGLAGPDLAGLLAGAGYVWLAVAITEDAASGASRRARPWNGTAWNGNAWDVTAWDMALLILAASVAVRAATPLGA